MVLDSCEQVNPRFPSFLSGRLLDFLDNDVCLVPQTVNDRNFLI